MSKQPKNAQPGKPRLVAMLTVTEENRKDLAKQLFEKVMEVKSGSQTAKKGDK